MRARALSLALAFALVAPVVASAQGMMDEMHRDLNQVQEKTLALANAIPESAYDWRPSAGARSVRELFLHVVADNYFIPIAMGMPVPAGIAITDYPSTLTYEKQTMTKAQIVAALTASFTHVHQGLAKTTDANMTEMIPFFGQQWSRQRAALLTVTHLHEHLGQGIAYARSNNIKPPWSN
jgi:uncharacterized damage-inducible protein DinB